LNLNVHLARMTDRLGSAAVLCIFGALALTLCGVAHGDDTTNKAPRSERLLLYTNDVIPDVPWSVHVVRFDYTNAELRLCTTLGEGEVMGMGNLTEQLKTLPRELGQPLAAINGDFYDKAKGYPSRPRNVQIRQGEVLTAPSGHACFWLDAEGRPQMTNVYSRFRVVWPDGKVTPVGLNAERTNGAAMLYSSVLGRSSLTEGGIEYTLESSGVTPSLPLAAGRTNQFRVRTVHPNGNNHLHRDTLILSISPLLAPKVLSLEAGAELQVITETSPNLAGVEVALGGGPSLVRDGRVEEWKGWIHIRHPRTALGWNKRYFYLVEVDGRQIDTSVGMTFPELAEYLVRLGCEQAMNLDGGGSATLWAFGSVRNSPSEGQERPAPNSLVVVRRNGSRAAK
jgi:hypothetical protein